MASSATSRSNAPCPGERPSPAGAGQTTMCPTEIGWDPAKPASLRLLPIETREGPQALREFIADTSDWKEVGFDAADPASIAEACLSISQTIRVTVEQAVNLGF